MSVDWVKEYPGAVTACDAAGRAITVLSSDGENLHFTGDIHAVTSANNLLAADRGRIPRRHHPVKS